MAVAAVILPSLALSEQIEKSGVEFTCKKDPDPSIIKQK
jgi:hypothetical protein